MKIQEVPQEKNKTLGGARKAIYAVDESGQYQKVAYDGWFVEEVVTLQAVEEFDRLAALALAEAQNGLSSPLAYHMYSNRMDIALLSQTTGFFKWTIKRDFKREVFDRISSKRAETYAGVMGIDVQTLLSFPKKG